MKKSLTKFASVTAAGMALCLLISDTQTASEAVRRALSICSGVILPSLLPFFFISGIISALGIPEALASIAHRPLSLIFGLSGYACAPLLLGLLGGYPIGAAAISELVNSNKLSAKEGEALLPVCNNTGPAFIIGAVGGGIFASARVGILLYAVHILSALILALIFRHKNTCSYDLPEQKPHDIGLVAVLPLSVRSAVEKSLSICGFVIFFSVLSSLLDVLGLLSSAALAMNKYLSLEVGFCRSLILGIMELGGGIASMSSLSPAPLSYALAAFVLGFGSLSVHCQTLALVSPAKIRCVRHFAGRIVHGALSALLTYFLSTLLRI